MLSGKNWARISNSIMSNRSEERKFYTEYEKILLANLVEQYHSIIECKQNKAVNILRKQEAWKEICETYNSHEVLERTPKQLKKLWENLKQKIRRSEKLKNGEDSPPKEDNVIHKVMSIVPGINSDDTGLDNTDCTSTSLDFEEEKNIEDKEYQIDISSLPEHNYELQLKQLNSEKRKRETEENEVEPLSKRKIKEKVLYNFVKEEYSLKLQKIQEAIEQQQELHDIRIRAALAEKRYWDTKTKLLNKNSPV